MFLRKLRHSHGRKIPGEIYLHCVGVSSRVPLRQHRAIYKPSRSSDCVYHCATEHQGLPLTSGRAPKSLFLGIPSTPSILIPYTTTFTTSPCVIFAPDMSIEGGVSALKSVVLEIANFGTRFSREYCKGRLSMAEIIFKLLSRQQAAKNRNRPSV